jgi:hypothetical protein
MDIEEKNKQIDFEPDDSSGESAGKKGEGRIFRAEEEGPKINLDAEIEKDIRIRTMPKKFKVSGGQGGKQNTAVGAIIMIVGFLVLSAAVYLSYVFLINPRAAKPSSAPKETTAPATKEKPAQTPAPSVPATTPSPAEKASSSPETGTEPVESTASTIPEAQATSTAPAISGIIDSDGDGLSNAEEVLLGTDPAKSDSDGDGYTDFAELFNLYNPAGSGKIIENYHISEYSNATAGYDVYYPKNWAVQSLDAGNSVIFSASDNSFIQIIAQPDSGGKGILEWYSEQFPEIPVAADKVIARDGWQGIFHEDKQIIYMADSAKKKIFVISYVPAAEGDESYYNIFLLMVNSFAVK